MYEIRYMSPGLSLRCLMYKRIFVFENAYTFPVVFHTYLHLGLSSCVRSNKSELSHQKVCLSPFLDFPPSVMMTFTNTHSFHCQDKETRGFCLTELYNTICYTLTWVIMLQWIWLICTLGDRNALLLFLSSNLFRDDVYVEVLNEDMSVT